MFLATINQRKRLLHLSYIGEVTVDELRTGFDDMTELLREMPKNLRVLADLGRLESMDIACVPQLGRAMELLEQHGIAMVVRVIPDPTKDIGMNIISSFHYHNRPRTVTCETMCEAAKVLEL
jgi:anti-anti-sigma regulatory factor